MMISAEDSRRALLLANQVRSARAAVRRQIAAGEVSVVTVLDKPPDWVLGMRLDKLVNALPGYGDRRTAKLLASCGIPYGCTVRRLGGLGLQLLIASLNGEGWR
jgi:hypothetical protein